MAKANDIYKALDQLAPFENALSFDNAGFLAGSRDMEVERVLLSLDITGPVIQEAAELGAQLLISHHPVIFSPLRSLPAESPAYQLAGEGLSAICAHTNLDIADHGVNFCLAEKIGLHDIGRSETCPELFEGKLEFPLRPEEFAGLCGKSLRVRGLRYINGGNQISKVMMCSGAGGEFITQAAEEGADAFLTGEMKHHELLQAKAAGITAVVAGHYETERVVLPFLREYLSVKFPGIQFEISQREENPVCGLVEYNY